MPDVDLKKAVLLIVNGDLNNSQIAQVCDIHRSTVAKYRRRLNAHSLNLIQIEDLSAKALSKHLKLKRQSPPSQWSEPNWEIMAQRLSSVKGTTITVLHDEYTRQVGSPMSYTRFGRCLRSHLKKRGPVMRHIRVPGEAFVDFSGKRPQVIDPETGKCRPVELFIGALGHSRLIYATAVPDQSTQSWIKAIVSMFEYFGGTPRYLVPDNLKAAVIRPRSATRGLILNPAFDRAMQHYRVTPLPARVGSPRDKGLVEQSVLHVKR